jgi:hypothetical protein
MRDRSTDRAALHFLPAGAPVFNLIQSPCNLLKTVAFLSTLNGRLEDNVLLNPYPQIALPHPNISPNAHVRHLSPLDEGVDFAFRDFLILSSLYTMRPS